MKRFHFKLPFPSTVSLVCLLAVSMEMAAVGETELGRLTKLIEVSSSLWPEGEMECEMSTANQRNSLKIWWMGSLCRREMTDLSSGRDGKVTIMFSDSRSRTYYDPVLSTVHIFSKTQRRNEVAWTRARPDESWTEIRSFNSVASWWKECLAQHQVTLVESNSDIFTFEVQKENLKPFPVVFNKHGLLVQAGQPLDHRDALGSHTLVEWKPTSKGPPSPEKFVQSIKPPGASGVEVYRQVDVKRFANRLNEDHPKLRMKLSDWPVGTLVIDHQGVEKRTFVGGEEGERQYRIKYLSKKLRETDSEQ